MPKVSVIIPALNAGDELNKLLDCLENQTVKAEIVVVDSMSKDNTAAIAEARGCRLILEPEFDHGRTRDAALRSCDSDYVLFLTQDAMPADSEYIEKLTAPLGECAVSFARQLPKDNATSFERLIREYNYPGESRTVSAEDVPKLGIKAYFFSDVASAYRRDVFEKLGGFEYPILTNEDMFYAKKLLENGYRIAYAADACVYHSHNYSLKEQYARNRIQGVEIAKRIPENLEGEGMKLFSYVASRLTNPVDFVRFCFDCAARLLGSRAGRREGKKADK